MAAGLVPLALGSDTGDPSGSPPRSAVWSALNLPMAACRAMAHRLRLVAGSDWPDNEERARGGAGPGSHQRPRPSRLDLRAAGGSEFTQSLTRDVRGLRIGVPRHLMTEAVDADVSAAFDAALEVARTLGATVTDVELPHARSGHSGVLPRGHCRASANLARFDGVRFGLRAGGARTLVEMADQSRHDGFGEVKRRITLGTYVLSAGHYDAHT